MEHAMAFGLRPCVAGIAFLAAAVAMDCATAQPERTQPITPRVIALAPARPGAPTIKVSSPDFANQNYQDRRFFQTVVGGLNMAPGVSWSAGPAGTQSYALVMEGEGGTRIDPTVHWIVYDIPAPATRLPTGIPKDAYINDPAGAINGREDSSVFRGTVDGEPGYRGPNFSADGGRPHPYYFEVFALDTKLRLDPAQAKRKAIVDAMQGHVLASGELMVKFGAENFRPPQRKVREPREN
jgi:Raf kinase inhibitor-like YbhB/YbcL family protein